MRRAALVAALVAAVVCLPASAARAATWGLPECDQALPGSAIAAALAQQATPVVCEPHPNDGRATTGWWDGTRIHLWVAGMPPGQVRKIAAHELGHAYADRLTLYEVWGHARGHDTDTTGPDGASWQREDFAEMFSLVNFPEQGVGYSYYLGPLTDQQRATMAAWWAGSGPRSVEAPVPPESYPTADTAPPPTPPTTTPPAPPTPVSATPDHGLIPAIAIIPPPATAARVAAQLTAMKGTTA